MSSSNFNVRNGLIIGSSGSVSSPAITFLSDTTTGFYTNLPGSISVSIGGNNLGIFSGTGLTINGNLKVFNSISSGSTSLTIYPGTFGGGISGTVTIAGNLQVQGTTTTVNNASITVTDKFISLGNTSGASDSTADGGGIILKGTTDKNFLWYNATKAWTLSERLNLPIGTGTTPSLFFGSSVSTGLYSPGTNQLGFSTAGVGRIFLTSNGNLGLGTTNPQEVLDVLGNVRISGSGTTFVTLSTLNDGSLSVGTNSSVVTNKVSTINTTDTSQIPIDTFYTSSGRSAKYIIQIYNSDANRFQTSEILLNHNGTNVFITEYAVVFTDMQLGAYDADISSGYIRLLLTPQYANNSIKVYRTLLNS